MSQIDIQNAKQIRDPMTVLISMEVPEDVAVTYSDFVNVKIEDAQLGQRAWPMRQLADLQGDGFALDGSRVLYDPNVTASAANGKIGVRGDVGEDVTFTVSGDSNINGLSLAATGTDRVLFNGQTATFSDGQVIIPVGSDSITLTFPAEETDRRVEVSFTLPGTSLKVTNDSIISCIVSLRSDLSIEDPTLPESELNVEIYNDVDISEAVASIPDDSPLIYSAGYPGDMSPDRKFYVAGQITWADNVLSIHAVDAVHFLDREIEPKGAAYMSVDDFLGYIVYDVNQSGVSVETEVLSVKTYNRARIDFFIPRQNLRELIAFVNKCFKFDGLPRSVFRYNYSESAVWFNYIDAGSPKFTNVKQRAQNIIYEEDCASLNKAIEPKITAIKTNPKEVYRIPSYSTIGEVEWNYEERTAFPHLDGFTDYIGSYGLRNLYIPGDSIYSIGDILPITSKGFSWAYVGSETISVKVLRNYMRPSVQTYRIYKCVDSESLQNVSAGYGYGEPAGIIYTQVIPKNAPFRRKVHQNDSVCIWPSQEAAWAGLKKIGIVTRDNEPLTLEIIGTKYEIDEQEKIFGDESQGKTLELDNPLLGRLMFTEDNDTIYNNAYPDMAMESLLQRSNVTGSFIWKGDPRMQPRDVVEFHRLDGTVEEITLENITLHHEGGGTYAEITYRKGVC